MERYRYNVVISHEKLKESMKSTFVVKGEIREYTFYGNHKLERKGTVDFLPFEPIYLNTNRKNFEDATHEGRVNVVGKHRSGINRHRKIKLSKVKGFKVDEIKNPSEKTIDYLDHVGIHRFQLDSEEHKSVKQILEVYNSIKPKEFLKSINEDFQLISAKKQIHSIKNILKGYNLNLLSEYVANQIDIISLNRISIKTIPHEEFMQRLDEFLNIIVKQSIMRTDINEIHPTEDKLIIGQICLKKLKNEELYRIREIQLLK